MPFIKDSVKVSKTSGKFMNLVHGSGTLTFAFKDCYSHFGVSHNKNFDNYSIGINVPEKLVKKLRDIEGKANFFG